MSQMDLLGWSRPRGDEYGVSARDEHPVRRTGLHKPGIGEAHRLGQPRPRKILQEARQAAPEGAGEIREGQPAHAVAGPPCTLCKSTARLTGGWGYAQTRSFAGRVHQRCLELYEKMVPLWREMNAEGNADFSSVLNALAAPRLGEAWDIHSPEFMVCEHAWRNTGRIVL